MFPVRCYTCNACLAQEHPRFRTLVRAGTTHADALATLAVRRMCCRRMFLGHVDLVEDQVRFPNTDTVLDDAGTTLYRYAPATRVVSCD